MSPIEIAIAGVACSVVLAVLMLRRRDQQHQREWERQLRTANEVIHASQRDARAARAAAADAQAERQLAQAEGLATQAEISAARSIAVAAEESRLLAMAMAAAAQAELAATRKSKPISKDAQPKKARAIPKPASACSCSQCQLDSAVQEVSATGINDAVGVTTAHPLLPAYLWPYVRNESVIPYADTKSKRGRKKEYNTEGFACPHHDCRYRGITNSAVHALVKYGNHGRNEQIPDLYCQACKRKITSRTMTALYRLHKPSEHIITTLNTLVEGMSEEGAVRGLPFYKLNSDSIRRWIARAAQHSGALQAILLKDLRFKVLQLDELRAKLRTPTNVLFDPCAKTDKRDELISWGWTAICPITRLVPVVQVGLRTQAAANSVLHELRARIHSTCHPIFLTDGLMPYYYAITAHWGSWVINEQTGKHEWQIDPAIRYAQLYKHKVRRKLINTEAVSLIGDLSEIERRLRQLGFSGKIQTSYIERLNVDLRSDIAALARRTTALMRSSKPLSQMTTLWQGYHNFCRPHSSLKLSKTVQPDPKLRDCTPAMAANIVDSVWSFEQFLRTPTFPALAQSLNPSH